MTEGFIHVHCFKCNRAIRAPRAAAGRYGKCPSCHNQIYVPSPDEDLEEIPLAPIDDEAERRDREARRVEAEIRREKGEGAGPARGGSPAARGHKEPEASAEPPAAAGQITDVILDYLLAMKGSDLEKARRVVGRLAKVRSQAHSRIQQLMVDAMPPPKLGDMPQGLYLGFLKKLGEALEEGA